MDGSGSRRMDANVPRDLPTRAPSSPDRGVSSRVRVGEAPGVSIGRVRAGLLSKAHPLDPADLTGSCPQEPVGKEHSVREPGSGETSPAPLPGPPPVTTAPSRGTTEAVAASPGKLNPGIRARGLSGLSTGVEPILDLPRTDVQTAPDDNARGATHQQPPGLPIPSVHELPPGVTPAQLPRGPPGRLHARSRRRNRQARRTVVRDNVRFRPGRGTRSRETAR